MALYIKWQGASGTGPTGSGLGVGQIVSRETIEHLFSNSSGLFRTFVLGGLRFEGRPPYGNRAPFEGPPPFGYRPLFHVKQFKNICSEIEFLIGDRLRVCLNGRTP